MNIEGKLKSRHLITSERSQEQPGFRIVGSAYKAEDQNYYTLHLRFLPGITYFLVINWADIPEFLIFSGRSKTDEGKSRFFHRIGSGFKRVAENLIEVHIPDLNHTLYLHLDAVDLHYLDRKSVA
jgi:hypothetical protein